MNVLMTVGKKKSKNLFINECEKNVRLQHEMYTMCSRAVKCSLQARVHNRFKSQFHLKIFVDRVYTYEKSVSNTNSVHMNIRVCILKALIAPNSLLIQRPWQTVKQRNHVQHS